MADRPSAGRMRGIGDLSTLPIFFKLHGRVAVLAGGSPPAVWKAELLAAAGAEVRVFDPAPCPEMKDLADALTLMRIEERRWGPSDLVGAALAIGALEGREAEAFRQAAGAAGVPVNIVDVPHLCDFQFGTIVDRDPLLIAISTDGVAPVFGQTLRARIEALLPAGIEAWARAAREWRLALQAKSPSFASRRRFWEEFSDRALSGNGFPPCEADRQACFDASLDESLKPRGAVDLVGLGPGLRDHLTLQAVRIMQAVDVLIYADDVDTDVLALARREAIRVTEPRTTIEAALMVERFVDDGRRVAWVGLGDPFCCPRWADRQTALSTRPRSITAGLRCQMCDRPRLGHQ